MKKKEKDDVMGEDVSSLPEAKSMPCFSAFASRANLRHSTMREPSLRLTASVVLSAADKKCGRASDIFLQMYQMQQAVEDVLSASYYLTWKTDFNGGSLSIPGARSLVQGQPIRIGDDSRLLQHEYDKQSSQGEGYLTPTAQTES
jgi:hypothetical protein